MRYLGLVLLSSLCAFSFSTRPLLADFACQQQGYSSSYSVDENQEDRCIHFFEYICLYGDHKDEALRDTISALMFVANRLSGAETCKDASRILDIQKSIKITRSSVSDLRPLIGFQNLEYLHLNGTSVASMALLTGLPNLRFLGLSNTQVSSELELVQLLQLLPKLESVFLIGTPLSSASPSFVRTIRALHADFPKVTLFL